MENATVRAVIYRDGDMWVAQCLEYDIAAQGKDVAEAHRRLALTLRLEREVTLKQRGTAFAGIGQAPSYFHQLYEETYLPTMSRDDMEMKLAA